MVSNSGSFALPPHFLFVLHVSRVNLCIHMFNYLSIHPSIYPSVLKGWLEHPQRLGGRDKQTDRWMDGWMDRLADGLTDSLCILQHIVLLESAAEKKVSLRSKRKGNV